MRENYAEMKRCLVTLTAGIDQMQEVCVDSMMAAVMRDPGLSLEFMQRILNPNFSIEEYGEYEMELILHHARLGLLQTVAAMGRRMDEKAKKEGE